MSNVLKYTKVDLELNKNVVLFQSFENVIRGGISGVFADRYIESNINIKISYIDTNNVRICFVTSSSNM